MKKKPEEGNCGCLSGGEASGAVKAKDSKRERVPLPRVSVNPLFTVLSLVHADGLWLRVSLSSTFPPLSLSLSETLLVCVCIAGNSTTF